MRRQGQGGPVVPPAAGPMGEGMIQRWVQRRRLRRSKKLEAEVAARREFGRNYHPWGSGPGAGGDL
jgi:hypothetical protein